MPLDVRDIQDNDIENAASVMDGAFGATSHIYAIMYPNGGSPAAKADMLKNLQKSFSEAQVTGYKVVDTDNNDRLVSWISWKTYKVDQPENEWNPPPKPKPERRASEEKNPDVNEEFASEYSSVLDVVKRNGIKGKARLHIDLLVTHPDYHRRGSGKMLLDKCAEHADDLGLPTFLESSPLAAGLYRREGFIDVAGAVATMDLSPYGYNEVHQNVLMIRHPKARS